MIELASGEYGADKIQSMVQHSENGKATQWFDKSFVDRVNQKNGDTINNSKHL